MKATTMGNSFRWTRPKGSQRKNSGNPNVEERNTRHRPDNTLLNHARKGVKGLLLLLFFTWFSISIHAEEMDELWGEQVVKLNAADAKRGQLFRDGNYAMFIHWGLYSNLANKVDGKTYYGIAEWIMHRRRANIPPAEYEKLAKKFNPTKFDAEKIVQLAKDAGMKYIVITSKHHDGFAMYDSKVSKFNIVEATPFKRDPMKELAKECEKAGIGFGFYYSQTQDWTEPGGYGGPKSDANGDSVSFDEYFEKKCLPQIEEITTKYGPMVLIWFDTPGGLSKDYVGRIIDTVRKNQPNALVSGRVGHDMGDYMTLGDMEIPKENIEGMWESVDTTNDSWGYAWYDQNWKTPKEILERLISCVARGGTYMLNIGPRGDGSLPERMSKVLRSAGDWIKRYPQVVYGTEPSPWKHALPWGEVTAKDSTLFLSLYKWPDAPYLYLPGLKTEITSSKLLGKEGEIPITFAKEDLGYRLYVPPRAAESLVSVIQIDLNGPPEVDRTYSLDPEFETTLTMESAEVEGAEKCEQRWMEKFGEWKCVTSVTKWSDSAKVMFRLNVPHPGEYQVNLTYSGEGRVAWGVDVVGGEHIQNEQNSSHNYQSFPIGWINFPKPGKYTLSVSCLEGSLKKASLKSIHFKPVAF